MSARTISLGWLFPYSSIFKELKKDLQQGLDTALQKDGTDLVIECHAEFAQSGSLPDTEKALKKLILYDNVDIVVAVCSSKVAVSIIPFLDSNRIPLVILNLGADIPVPALSSDHLFYNSLHLWMSEWAIGKWAQEKWGGEPSLNVALYESGYLMQEAFKTGAAAGGATSIKLNLIKNLSPAPDTSPLIQYLKTQRPAHAHALLSWKEGDQFLDLYRREGLASSTHLTVNPFMVEDDIVEQLPEGLALYNAITWTAAAGDDFTRAYNEQYDHRPNAFSLLAYETGLAICAAAREVSGKLTKQKLSKALGQIHPRGPRGEINLSTRPLQTNMPVYIRLPVQHPPGPMNHIHEIVKGIEWNDPSFSVGNHYSSGWQNPYLCV